MVRGFPMIELVQTDFSVDGHGKAIIFLLDEYAAEIREGVRLPEYVRENLAGELDKRPGIHTVLVFVDGNPAGFAISIEGFSTFACRPLLNIHDVFVLPAYRGRGLSRLLLEKTEEIARRLGCCKLTLEVLENNIPAIRLYETSGYAGYELDPKLGRAVFLQKSLNV